MFIYNKCLQFPVKVGYKDVRMAKNIITQYGGSDGEAGASLRYLTQRYHMPLKEQKGALTDIGTEELGHMEMVGVIFEKLLCGATRDELEKNGLSGYYVDHGCNPFYVDTAGITFDTKVIGSKGDAIADLNEDLAAEAKAKITYEHLIQMTDDPDLKNTLRFLREREVVHYQRFGELLRLQYEEDERKKCY